MTKKLELLVEEVIERQVGNTAIILGYFEHQVDLLAKITKELSELVDQEKMSEDLKGRLATLDSLLEQSSVNFENIDSPLESYKLPGAVDKKRIMRDIQNRYLTAKTQG